MTERRVSQVPLNCWWEQLNLAQKFAAHSLFQFGFQLAFIRRVDDEPLAVFLREHEIAALDKNGDLDLHPAITLRD